MQFIDMPNREQPLFSPRQPKMTQGPRRPRQRGNGAKARARRANWRPRSYTTRGVAVRRALPFWCIPPLAWRRQRFLAANLDFWMGQKAIPKPTNSIRTQTRPDQTPLPLDIKDLTDNTLFALLSLFFSRLFLLDLPVV